MIDFLHRVFNTKKHQIKMLDKRIDEFRLQRDEWVKRDREWQENRPRLSEEEMNFINRKSRTADLQKQVALHKQRHKK